MKNTILKKGIHYQLDENGKPQTYQRWAGDFLAGWYDRLMEKSVFPKKFNACYDRHIEILQEACSHVHGANVLELATGSGNVISFLPIDNTYIGTDISPGLLKIASRKLHEAGFSSYQLHICDVANLPFDDENFDLVLCQLSLNFFPDVPVVLKEVTRVLKPGGSILCSIPLPEKKPASSTIRGTLYHQDELDVLCCDAGLRFHSFHKDNGCLEYFWGYKES